MMRTVETLTLSEFLLARITEDEAFVMIGSDSFAESDAILPTTGARVLAECEAKRRIILSLSDSAILEELVDPEIPSGYWAQGVVYRALALPYADHPDCREEWRP